MRTIGQLTHTTVWVSVVTDLSGAEGLDVKYVVLQSSYSDGDSCGLHRSS